MSHLSLRTITGSNFSYQHFSFERFLDDMVELGLQELELWGIAPHLHIPQVTATDLERIRRQLSSRDLSVHCVTPEQVMYPVNIASPNPVLRADSIIFFKRAAEVCAELGGKQLFLTPGRGAEDESVDAAWRRSVDALEEICVYARSLGLGCLLEPLQRVESNLVNCVEQLRAMLDELDERVPGGFDVVLDVVAMHAADDTIEGYFDAFPGRVGHVHVIDGDPVGHLAWGDGTLPLDQDVRSIADHDYGGHITFEHFGDGSYSLDPRTALEQSIMAFERMISQENCEEEASL